MASENVFDVAKKLGYWDGKEPFKFWKAYSGKNYSGQLKSFSTREHFILNALAPSLKLDYEAEELPISVKTRQASICNRCYGIAPGNIRRNAAGYDTESESYGKR